MVTNIVLLPELLGERRGHDHTPHGGGSGEVRLAGLSPVGGDACGAHSQHLSITLTIPSLFLS